MRRSITAAIALMLTLATGCEEKWARPAGASSAAPPAPSVSAAKPASTAAEGPSAAGTAKPKASSTGDDARPEIKKLTFTSEVKKREPADKLTSAGPGDRVYAHLFVKNRTEATCTLTVVFAVNGDERSRVKLDIDPSWGYRTWAYNTLRKTDTKGELTVEVRDDDGTVLATGKLPIKAP